MIYYTNLHTIFFGSTVDFCIIDVSVLIYFGNVPGVVQIWARCGTDMAWGGTDMAWCGTDMAWGGMDMAWCGTDMARE